MAGQGSGLASRLSVLKAHARTRVDSAEGVAEATVVVCCGGEDITEEAVEAEY